MMKWIVLSLFITLFTLSIYFSFKTKSEVNLDNPELSEAEYKDELQTNEEGVIPERKSLQYAMETYVKTEDAITTLGKLKSKTASNSDFIHTLEKNALYAPELAVKKIQERLTSEQIQSTQERMEVLTFSARLNNIENVASLAQDEILSANQEKFKSTEDQQEYIFRAQTILIRNTTNPQQALSDIEDAIKQFEGNPTVQANLANHFLWYYPDQYSNVKGLIQSEQTLKRLAPPRLLQQNPRHPASQDTPNE